MITYIGGLIILTIIIFSIVSRGISLQKAIKDYRKTKKIFPIVINYFLFAFVIAVSLAILRYLYRIDILDKI